MVFQKACNELCRKAKGRRDQGNTLWWNEQAKEAIDKKKKHLIRDARIAHRKIRTIIGKRETKQRKWSQKP